MTLTDRLRDSDPLGHRLPDPMVAPELPFELRSGGQPAPRRKPRRSPRPLLALVAIPVAAVAVVVAVLLIASGSPASRPVAEFTASTELGQPATTGQLQRSADLVQERLRLAGGDDLAVRAGRTGQLTVSCASCNSGPAAKLVDAVSEPGRLAFYDWEDNVLDSRCRPAPQSRQVTGGAQAGELGSLSLYEAVERAASCPTATYRDMARDQPSYYLVNPFDQTVVSGPAKSADAVRRDATATGSTTAGLQVRRVPTGVVLLRAPADRLAAPNDAGLYLLRDRPALTGADITNPGTVRDPSSDETNVQFNIKPAAQPAFRRLTREVARRGIEAAKAPGSPSPVESAQHFAIALDDALLSVPYIDEVQNPDGLDPSQGTQLATTSRQESLTIAALLKTGVLPADLQAAPKTG